MPAAATWLPPVDQHHDGWRFTLLRQDQGGRQVCVGVVVMSAEPGDGTAGRALTVEVLDKLAPLLNQPAEAPAPEVGGDPDAKLRRVAAVYKQALADGVRPVKAVEAEFGVAHGTAGNLVWRARKRGFLKETTPGRAA